jgi:hypothetical protein
MAIDEFLMKMITLLATPPIGDTVINNGASLINVGNEYTLGALTDI